VHRVSSRCGSVCRAVVPVLVAERTLARGIFLIHEQKPKAEPFGRANGGRPHPFADSCACCPPPSLTCRWAQKQLPSSAVNGRNWLWTFKESARPCTESRLNHSRSGSRTAGHCQCLIPTSWPSAPVALLWSPSMIPGRSSNRSSSSRLTPMAATHRVTLSLRPNLPNQPWSQRRLGAGLASEHHWPGVAALCVKCHRK
jgi:hypothetical protein